MSSLLNRGASTTKWGIVVSVVEARGYGFIERPHGGRDLYFHATKLVDLEFGDSLRGKRVQFDVEETAKGPQAVNVRAAD